MFDFYNFEYLYLLILIFIAFYIIRDKKEILGVFAKDVFEKISFKNNGFSKKTRKILLIFSFIFAIIALARPFLNNGEIKVKSSFINMVVGIDISKSMMVDDLYPNRFEFAKNKFFSFLDIASDKQIALVAFSKNAFLISPLTKDFSSLKFLAKNLSFSFLDNEGTSIMAFLKSANELLKEKNKAVLIFSDGGDKKNFDKEIKYAKTNNIKVYVYNTATKKGGLLKDKNDNLTLLSENENIKNLALKTNAAYMSSSLDKNDLKLLNDEISSNFKSSKQFDSIKDEKELFYFPLIISIILFFMANFSLPKNYTRKSK